MKNIIIAGPSRAGKTTLARRVNEELGFFIISLDKLVAVFHGAYPQLDIRLNWDREKTTDNIAPFVGHFLGAFSSDQGVSNELNLKAHETKGNKFVLEGGYFNFEIVLPILELYGIKQLHDSFILIGLVQNEKTANEKTANEFVNDFKKYDTEDDWTYSFSDDELRDYAIHDAIPFSHFMTEHLLKYGFTIYDTSTERDQVFDSIIENIKSELL